MPELPLEIWKERIKNEIQSLEHLKVLEEGSVVHNKNSVKLIINLKALGFILKPDNNLITIKNHRVFLKLNRTYPYPGGIDFFWHSNIFHPNIHPVELPTNEMGTGYICLNELKKWNRLSDLETTVKALQMLVENPNPDDPLNYPICSEASVFFKQNTMQHLRKKGDKDDNLIKDKNEEVDIIIIDN